MNLRFRVAAVAVALLAFASIVPAAAADETVFVYRRIYRLAETLQQRYAAVLSISAADDPQAAPVLAEALDDLLLIQANYESPGDRELHARIVRDVLVKLGAWRHLSAAPSTWLVVEQLDEPLARAEALMALGSMRAVDYVERIALVLRDLNFGPGADPAGNEKLAFAAVYALERLRDVRGFSAVFFASDGWYGRRVRELALWALPNIAADPTEAILEIVRVESLERKLRALELELGSKAEPESKLQVVALALETTVGSVPRDKSEAAKVAALRRAALRGFVAQDGSGGAQVTLFQTVYREATEVEDRLLALQALGVDGSEAAAEALADFILILDDQQRRGITDERRDQVAKAAVLYAGMTKSQKVSTALTAVMTNDRWSNSIIAAATEALKALE